MDRINLKFSQEFGGHWIKAKFYKKKPNLKEGKRIKGVRFCEAVKEAIMYPILLDRESISCEGAQYALGWKSKYKNAFLNNCHDKNQIEIKALRSLLSNAPYFKKPFEYIGLNTEGEPDLIISFPTPEKIKELIKIYNYHHGGNLDVSLSSMMPICGGIAVKSYLEGRISLSFGCDDSRKFTGLGRDTLTIGIPNRLFKVFVN